MGDFTVAPSFESLKSFLFVHSNLSFLKKEKEQYRDKHPVVCVTDGHEAVALPVSQIRRSSTLENSVFSLSGDCVGGRLLLLGRTQQVTQKGHKCSPFIDSKEQTRSSLNTLTPSTFTNRLIPVKCIHTVECLLYYKLDFCFIFNLIQSELNFLWMLFVINDHHAVVSEWANRRFINGRQTTMNNNAPKG